MCKLTVFNFMTLNGINKGTNGDLSWHKHGQEEEHEYAVDNVKKENILLFGRITYEMMAGFWPTSEAIKMDPIIAEGMNKASKIVFSTTLQEANWNNSRIVSGDITEEIKKLKQASGKDMAIMGSGSILTQFADLGLIDEYHLMLDPIAIGSGTAIFQGIKNTLNLELIDVRKFKSGTILLSYQPANN